MRRAGLILVIGLLGIAGSSLGQGHADFSGTWKMDPARSESAHQDATSGALTSTLVIQISDNDLTMETTRDEGSKGAVFHEALHLTLDGQEKTGPGDAGVAVTGKAHWDGAKLVVETVRNVQGSTVTTLYVHTLSASGRELTVDKTLNVQHGYQGMGATPAGHGKDVFVRVEK